MINRRQALCSREPLATVFFLSLILVFFFALPNILVRAEPASSGVSAATGEAQRVSPGGMKPEASPLASLKAPDTNQRIAILALVLACLSAITFIFWRHHRRDYASPRRIGRGI